MEKFLDELDFENDLLDLIKKNFNVKEPIKYMVLKYMIINNKNLLDDVDIKDFVEFIIKENNLPNLLIYKNFEFSKFDTTKESFYNICNNWIFDIKKDIISSNFDFVENLLKVIRSDSVKKSSNFRKVKYYKKVFLKNCLSELNNNFDVHLMGFYKMNNVEYPNDFQFEDYYENLLEAKIDNLIKKDIDNHVVLISEKELETYIKKYLNKLESNLKFLSAQYPIKDGFIDILAKDKDNNKVIIELKVKDDERLIWQMLYYPKQYKKEHPNDNIRIISLCPSYPNFLLEVLKDLKGIECFKYELELTSELSIKDINFVKII